MPGADAGRGARRARAGAGVNLRRYVDIVLFKAYADLQAERQRTYLGFLWWVFEPLMYMAVMWAVFSRVLGHSSDDYPVFLLIGLVFWQWFKSCVSHGSVSVLQAHPLIQLVALPPVIFPLVSVLTDCFKFAFILVLLLVLLLVTGHALSPTLLALPLVLLAELAVICAVTIWLSALIPFVPDLRFVTENALIAVMFLSGIFYDASVLPGFARVVFDLNPMALLIGDAHEILMHGRWPDVTRLLLLFAGSVLACVTGALVLERLRRHYPKLPR